MRKTEQVKKYLVIGGGIVIGLGLMVAICMQFGKASEEKDSPKQNPSVTTKMVVNPDESTTESSHVEEPRESTIESSLAVKPKEKNSSTNTKKKQPVDRRVEQTNQIQQKIQPDVTKPKSPSKKALTDPNKKPDGTKVDTPPEPVEHERVEKTKEAPTQSKEPQGGDTKDGKVYLPGFGWVTDTGGSGTDANDMYENGNKIGSMD